MNTYKEKDRVYHPDHGPGTVWATCSKGMVVGIQTDDGNLIIASHKSLTCYDPKDHWVANATNLLTNGGMEAVHDALATGALPMPEPK